MQLTNSPSRYGAVPQSVHWLTAVFVVVGWLIGQFGDVLPKGSARDTGLLVHMGLGQCVIVLLVFRVIWRLANPPPPPEKTPLGRLLEIVAQVSHVTLYALLITVPFLGIIVQLKRAGELPLFGLWPLPSPVDRATSRTILSLHGTLADALLILAFVHASAALVLHHWIWRDRTLVRMLPGVSR
jgi:cytochrome b561